MRGYDVRPCDAQLKAGSFSGGNQQKLVLAREMEHDPDLLLVGQPTRGVDIGAIEFIHKRLIEMRDRGKAVLLVSVELDEIRSLAGPHPRDVRRHDHGRAQRRGRRRAPDRPPDGRRHRGSGGVTRRSCASRRAGLRHDRRARAAAPARASSLSDQLRTAEIDPDGRRPSHPATATWKRDIALRRSPAFGHDRSRRSPRARGSPDASRSCALDDARSAAPRVGHQRLLRAVLPAVMSARRSSGKSTPKSLSGILAQQGDVGVTDAYVLLSFIAGHPLLDALRGLRRSRHVLGGWLTVSDACVGMPAHERW